MITVAGLTVKDTELLVWDKGKTAMQVKLGDLVQYFQVGIPTTENQIPKLYVDPTVLTPYLLDVTTPDDISDDIISSAKVPIDFEEGFPTIDGVPFWERLEGEPVPYYKLFKEYREMKYIGDSNENGSFTRSIAKLAESSGMLGRQLNALSKAYHWQARAKAYDVNKALERQVARERDVAALESRHAKISNQLLDQAVDYLTDHPEQLSPKIALDMVQLAMKSGRLALGLNPDKPGSASGGTDGRGTSVNIINQNNSAGGDMNQVNVLDDLSAVEKKTQENSKDVSHLQSILHILNESGAFANANGTAQESKGEDEEDFVDADYEVKE